MLNAVYLILDVFVIKVLHLLAEHHGTQVATVQRQALRVRVQDARQAWLTRLPDGIPRHCPDKRVQTLIRMRALLLQVLKVRETFVRI